MRSSVISLALFAAFSASADSRFRVAIMPRPEVQPGKGQCDIRLSVDNEVEITIRRDQVVVHTLSGEDAHDDGSDCNVALPAADMPNFALQTVDSRSEIRLVQKPSSRNDFGVVVRILDSAAGAGRYHFRLSWDSAPAAAPIDNQPPLSRKKSEERPPAPPGFVWNNAIEYRGTGSGESVLNESTKERLSDVMVAIDLGGKAVVAFWPDPPRGPRGGVRKRIVFTGTLMSREGSRIRVNLVTEDQRLRGTMTLSVDEKHSVNSITMNATDGQDHLHITWDRH
jgi:hypothetical protein